MSPTRAALAAAAVVVLALVLGALLAPARALAYFNARIARQCSNGPFLSTAGGRPPAAAVMPGLAPLEAAAPAIRAELDAVLAGGRDAIPALDAAYDGLFDRISSDGWRAFNLVVYGRDVPANAARCPATMRALRATPGVQTAFFSILAPRAHIPSHRGPTKSVLRYHLGLKVPRDRARCYIVVGGERYSWAEGEGVLLDDMFEHHVRNDTDEERAVLFVDLARDHLAGWPRVMQRLSAALVRHHPKVRRIIRASEVQRKTDPPGAAGALTS